MRTKNKLRKAITKNASKRRSSRTRMQKAILAGKALLIATILTSFTLVYFNLNIILKDFYQLTADAGFIVKEITIDGQKYVSNKEISQVLKVKTGAPIFAVSLLDLKNRLEQLEWIKLANVERQLPNNIHISVIERTPIALGQKDHKLHIIDDEGAIINEKNLTTHAHLPIMIGDGAEIYANSLINILKVDPELFKRISAIIRISEHRWNIRFDNALEVKLPDYDTEKAWQKVIKMHKDKMLFSPDNAVIDLRIPKKIFIEKK